LGFDPIEYIYSFSLFGRKGGYKPGLERISFMLEEAGNPHLKFETVHIGGTNGKGSTAAFLDSILQARGLRTGRFTSPHLHHYGERMMINNQPLDDASLVELVGEIKPIIEKVEKNTGEGPPSFFEVTAFLAFYYFAREKIDLGVMEVGLGGRLDATNTVKPTLTAITNVGLEHTHFLGDTIEKIAWEKAGIIKEGIPLITGAQSPALEIIKGRAEEKNAPLTILSEDYSWDRQEQRLEGQKFNLEGPSAKYNNLSIPLPGRHQMENAVLAVVLAEQLGVKEKIIREGLARAYWPGRLEVAGLQPLIILDGAHNLTGFEMLTSFLDDEFPGQQVVFVLSFLKDKDINPFLEKINHRAQAIIFSRADNFRAASPWALREMIKDEKIPVEVIPRIGEALARAREISGPGGIVCLTGSLYAVGEGREVLGAGEYLSRI